MIVPEVFWVIIRTSFIFLYAFLLLRLLGKRQLAQLTIFDLLIIISLGSAVGDAMIYPETTTQLINSVVAIAVVVLIQLAIYVIIARNAKIGRLIEGRATLLVKDGRVLEENLIRENINTDELVTALRERGIFKLGQVKQAILESTGKLSVIKTSHNHQTRCEKFLKGKKVIIGNNTKVHQ